MECPVCQGCAYERRAGQQLRVLAGFPRSACNQTENIPNQPTKATTWSKQGERSDGCTGHLRPSGGIKRSWGTCRVNDWSAMALAGPCAGYCYGRGRDMRFSKRRLLRSSFFTVLFFLLPPTPPRRIYTLAFQPTRLSILLSTALLLSDDLHAVLYNGCA